MYSCQSDRLFGVGRCRRKWPKCGPTCWLATPHSSLPPYLAPHSDRLGHSEPPSMSLFIDPMWFSRLLCVC